MTKRRYVLFAVITVVVSVCAVMAALLATDLYLHWKYRDLVGLNTWGYRGPAVGSKQPGEWRLAVVGESTAFGYGVHWRDAIPALLQERLTSERPVTVVNLAYNNEGAHSYRFTLEDYDYLDYDAVLLYSGYNDRGPNTEVFRHRSVVYRMTGYLPIFPLIFKEKAMVIRWGGALEDAYWGRKTTFVPSITQRATATALETAVSISESLDRQFANVTAEKVGARVDDEATLLGVDCGALYEHYCGEMYLAIKLARERGRRVLMVTQPYIAPDHREQQAVLRRFLDRSFGRDRDVRFANLGDEVDLKDPALAYDGMHLTPAGNRRIAAALERHVRTLMP